MLFNQQQITDLVTSSQEQIERTRTILAFRELNVREIRGNLLTIQRVAESGIEYIDSDVAYLNFMNAINVFEERITDLISAYEGSSSGGGGSPIVSRPFVLRDWDLQQQVASEFNSTDNSFTIFQDRLVNNLNVIQFSLGPGSDILGSYAELPFILSSQEKRISIQMPALEPGTPSGILIAPKPIGATKEFLIQGDVPIFYLAQSGDGLSQFLLTPNGTVPMSLGENISIGVSSNGLNFYGADETTAIYSTADVSFEAISVLLISVDPSYTLPLGIEVVYTNELFGSLLPQPILPLVEFLDGDIFKVVSNGSYNGVEVFSGDFVQFYAGKSKIFVVERANENSSFDPEQYFNDSIAQFTSTLFQSGGDGAQAIDAAINNFKNTQLPDIIEAAMQMLSPSRSLQNQALDLQEIPFLKYTEVLAAPNGTIFVTAPTQETWGNFNVYTFGVYIKESQQTITYIGSSAEFRNKVWAIQNYQGMLLTLDNTIPKAYLNPEDLTQLLKFPSTFSIFRVFTEQGGGYLKNYQDGYFGNTLNLFQITENNVLRIRNNIISIYLEDRNEYTRRQNNDTFSGDYITARKGRFILDIGSTANFGIRIPLGRYRGNQIPLATDLNYTTSSSQGWAQHLFETPVGAVHAYVDYEWDGISFHILAIRYSKTKILPFDCIGLTNYLSTANGGPQSYSLAEYQKFNRYFTDVYQFFGNTVSPLFVAFQDNRNAVRPLYYSLDATALQEGDSVYIVAMNFDKNTSLYTSEPFVQEAIQDIESGYAVRIFKHNGNLFYTPSVMDPNQFDLSNATGGALLYVKPTVELNYQSGRARSGFFALAVNGVSISASRSASNSADVVKPHIAFFAVKADGSSNISFSIGTSYESSNDSYLVGPV